MNPTSQASTQTSPLHVEDLNVGDQWTSDWREITGDDVADFAQLSGDHDPLHTDQAAESPFGEPVAHGLLGLSVLAGLSTKHPEVATLALVSISDWKFEAPIFFGQRVQVLTIVEEIQPHGRRAARVTWLRKLLNEEGRIVQQGRFISLVATKSRVRRSSAKTHPDDQSGNLPR